MNSSDLGCAVCLEKPFLSAGWVADGAWRGQQQREGAEIVVSGGNIPTPGISFHWSHCQLQPGQLQVGQKGETSWVMLKSMCVCVGKT